jgi:gas vesicle protein
MADQTFTEKTASTQNFEGASRTAKSAADQVSSSAKDLKEQASEFASSSGETIREQASDYVDAAKQAGADATDRLKEMLETQKHAGARYVGGIADAMRRAAREFDNDLPFAGTFLRKAASQVDTASGSVKNGDLNDLFDQVQDFARSQPAAFLGMTVLAGFGIVRVLKSSNRHSSGEYSEMGRSVSPNMSENAT